MGRWVLCLGALAFFLRPVVSEKPILGANPFLTAKVPLFHGIASRQRSFFRITLLEKLEQDETGLDGVLTSMGPYFPTELSIIRFRFTTPQRSFSPLGYAILRI
jgi:hypothetical protein